VDVHDGVKGVIAHALLFLGERGGFGVGMGRDGGEDEAAEEVVGEREGAAERHGFSRGFAKSRRRVNQEALTLGRQYNNTRFNV
jgi:hypothetical protein